MITLYGHIIGLRAGGQKSHKMDVLRAAVVLLHASLEDLVRNLVYWKLPDIAVEKWDKFKCGDRKISISDLVRQLDANVLDVLKPVIKKYLDETSYNDSTQLMGGLEQIGVDRSPLTKYLQQIDCMIKRRHQIVHQSDRSEYNAKSHGTPVNIDASRVREWKDSVFTFGKLVIDQLDPELQE